MAQDFAKRFYSTQKWQRCRKAYISARLLIDGGLCECCHLEPGYIVHHTILLTKDNIDDPNVSLNPENLRYECKRCHDLEEGHWYDSKGIAKPRAFFDDKGNPVDVRRL